MLVEAVLHEKLWRLIEANRDGELDFTARSGGPALALEIKRARYRRWLKVNCH